MVFRHVTAPVAAENPITFRVAQESREVLLDVLDLMLRPNECDRIFGQGRIPGPTSDQRRQPVLPEMQLAAGRFSHARVAQVDYQIGLAKGSVELTGRHEPVKGNAFRKTEPTDELLHFFLAV